MNEPPNPVFKEATAVNAQGQRKKVIVMECSCGNDTFCVYELEGSGMHVQCAKCNSVYCQHEGACGGEEKENGFETRRNND